MVRMYLVGVLNMPPAECTPSNKKSRVTYRFLGETLCKGGICNALGVGESVFASAMKDILQYKGVTEPPKRGRRAASSKRGARH
ncbi:hypothetical protein PTSG_12084 [Salpingoeca rosetta]|uniref:Uncharacterized protein n=1 Tax=Salpingoeca rosetta (strain ATCC 50818 / BSB-021) TaxID=946362 RepID=F2U5H3_SALR5|nr:uncharacterized protein PTSG_12084 [Salpingoeca rosetta]EGD83189.1 hypothetical protein PTSG_12084 [Salpingoeca rosetta]|eukprot:XP_004995553.1 hypothetical protein PTSG_12084 [Salpingoeca rosetta]